MKTGLVMEGGGMRGMFTCGVIDVLMENGIAFEAAAGVSAGAVFGCNIKSRQIGRGIRYNKRFAKDPRYAGLKSLLTTGDIYNVSFCYHTLIEEIDIFDRETFAENPMRFYVGATDVVTGGAAFHCCTDGGTEDIEWLRASASVPLVSRVVEIGEDKLLDGGIACPVPYRFMEEQGYARNLVILTQPKGYIKHKNRLMPLVRMMLRKYPGMIRAMEERHILYNRQMQELAEREADGKCMIVRPPAPLNIKSPCHDPEELERVYQTGREEALRLLPEIRAFCAAHQGEV